VILQIFLQLTLCISQCNYINYTSKCFKLCCTVARYSECATVESCTLTEHKMSDLWSHGPKVVYNRSPIQEVPCTFIWYNFQSYKWCDFNVILATPTRKCSCLQPQAKRWCGLRHTVMHECVNILKALALQRTLLLVIAWKTGKWRVRRITANSQHVSTLKVISTFHLYTYIYSSLSAHYSSVCLVGRILLSFICGFPRIIIPAPPQPYSRELSSFLSANPIPSLCSGTRVVCWAENLASTPASKSKGGTLEIQFWSCCLFYVS
jgi:hypothetical protein